LSAASTRGRTTLLVFGASYDLATQVAARELDALVRRRKPRINVGLVMLEASEYSPLVAGFRSALGLEYPVVLADEATLAGEGEFGEVGTMPLYVVLDRSGRECWRGAGVTDPATLNDVLHRAEALGAKGTRGAAR
jgi:hypothetical protein